MAKPIIVQFGDSLSSFDHRKLDRSKLYGKRQRATLDPEGDPCAKAELTLDGDLLVRKGMTAQGYFDDAGTQYASKDLTGFDAEGNVLEKVSSTLGAPVELTGPISAEALLDTRIGSVYMLEAAELADDLRQALEGGAVFQFPFAYRGGYNSDVGFLLHNEHGFFALVGDPVESTWSELEHVAIETYTDTEDDDLDFDMF